MKRLAHVENDRGSEIISIWEAAHRKRNNPRIWDGHTYYDIARLRPMSARTTGKNEITFAYKPGYGPPGHGEGSKGIAHELVQEHMCHLQDWHVTILNREIDLSFEKVEDEILYTHPETNEKIYVDCVATLKPTSPFVSVFGSEIAIEVVDKHDISLTKQQILQELGVTTFKFKVFEEWHIKTADEPFKTVDDIRVLRNRINGALEKASTLKLVYCSNAVNTAFDLMGIPKKVKATPKAVPAVPVPMPVPVTVPVRPTPPAPTVPSTAPAAARFTSAPPAVPPTPPAPPRVIQANVASGPARHRSNEKNPAGFAIAAIVFVVLGLAAAWITADTHSATWPDSLHTAFWIVIGSSVLSAISASISLSIKGTWYGIVLTILCVLYAGLFSLFAISLGFH